MVEPQNIPRNEFPKSTAKSNGMHEINVSIDNHALTYYRDVEYLQRNGKSLYLQIIVPYTEHKELFPLIVYVPGSAFHKQNVPSCVSTLSLLASKGYTVALLEYRGSEEAAFPAQMLDAKQGLRFMQKNAEKYNADCNNIFVMGDSSGGHTALMAGLTTGIKKLEEDDNCVYVNGVIDLYGPVNIATMNCELSSQDHRTPDSPEGYLIGRKNVLENPELVYPTVVTNYIEKNRKIPPVLVFHGTNDELVSFSQSCELHDKLCEEKKEVYFYAINGAHHGGEEFWCEQVLNTEIEFIKKNMK